MLELRTRRDAKHELGDALARDLCGNFFAKLVGRCIDARERGNVGISTEVFARSDESHEHARRIRRGYDGRQRQVFDLRIVDFGEGVRQRVEHLTAQLKIFVMASRIWAATTSTF
jgi:hypothetical protein